MNILEQKIQTLTDKIDTVARMAYLDGQIKGITDYAIWRNGEQLVGCLERPLKEVIAPLEEERKKIKDSIFKQEAQ